MNFADILASSIHDIKNSLSMVINTLDELLNDPDTSIPDKHKTTILQHEAQRANNTLIQLLGLYKFETEQVPINIAEHNLEDFLDEVVAENQVLAEAFGVEIEEECDEYLVGYFDDELVRGVLNSAIGNALRYTKDKIKISADTDGEDTVIRIEDDGRGFPQAILDLQKADPEAGDLNAGRTQLGIAFAEKVALSHTKGEKTGSIKMLNNYSLAGGCFELRLP